MGTMLQGSDATLEDFGGYEGCNEILNVTRPELVRGIYDGYLAAGADCISTNSFGANLGNLGEYGIADRIEELSETGARLARQAADAAEAADSRPRWVLGSMGPGSRAAGGAAAPRRGTRRRRRPVRRQPGGPPLPAGAADRGAAPARCGRC